MPNAPSLRSPRSVGGHQPVGRQEGADVTAPQPPQGGARVSVSGPPAPRANLSDVVAPSQASLRRDGLDAHVANSVMGSPRPHASLDELSQLIEQGASGTEAELCMALQKTELQPDEAVTLLKTALNDSQQSVLRARCVFDQENHSLREEQQLRIKAYDGVISKYAKSTGTARNVAWNVARGIASQVATVVRQRANLCRMVRHTYKTLASVSGMALTSVKDMPERMFALFQSNRMTALRLQMNALATLLDMQYGLLTWDCLNQGALPFDTTKYLALAETIKKLFDFAAFNKIVIDRDGQDETPLLTADDKRAIENIRVCAAGWAEHMVGLAQEAKSHIIDPALKK